MNVVAAFGPSPSCSLLAKRSCSITFGHALFTSMIPDSMRTQGRQYVKLDLYPNIQVQ